MLQEYGNLEQIYENLDNIQKRTAEKLKQSKKEALLSRKLARIITDIDLSVPSFRRQSVQMEKLRELLKELGFKTFEKKFCPQNEQNEQNKQKRKLSSNLKLHYLNESELYDLIQPYSKIWVFSKEDQYFLAYKNKVISLENHHLQKTGQLFSDNRIYWCGYDLKRIWKDFGCVHPIPYWCTMIAAYLIKSGPPGGVESLCLNYTDREMSDSLAPGEIYHIHKKLKKALQLQLTELNMIDLYEKMELPLVTVLYEMERKGIMLDAVELNRQAEEVNRQIKAVEREVFDYAKHEFNISSTKQLADVLFTEMGLKPIRKTKTGYSTDMEVLNKLKAQHPMVPLILEHRELFKLKTTYIEALPPLIRKKTGRVHTHFRQALTTTGRLSSINPNLQNIPIKTKRGRKIRQAFIAPKGKRIISADYSQIELRILAHVTEDPALCSAF